VSESEGGYQAPGEQLEAAMTRLMAQFGAMAGEAMQPDRFEYAMVQWSDVNRLAADGWELRAADIRLTQFVMARKLGAADEARALLERLTGGRVIFGPDGVPYGPFSTPEDGAGGPG